MANKSSRIRLALLRELWNYTKFEMNNYKITKKIELATEKFLNTDKFPHKMIFDTSLLGLGDLLLVCTSWCLLWKEITIKNWIISPFWDFGRIMAESQWSTKAQNFNSWVVWSSAFAGFEAQNYFYCNFYFRHMKYRKNWFQLQKKYIFYCKFSRYRTFYT
jgi:hypothetical protein